MATKGDNPGLFSKVVAFVRNPATSWAELDSQGDEARESGYSKQMLKEMIERKRRNDFVRKREFDMLRKLRRSEAMAAHDAAARPSFFQSSMPSRPDDRASTLKKIDEIEAQMSQQWWKTRAPETTRTGGMTTSSGPVPQDTVHSSAPTRLSELRSLEAPLPTFDPGTAPGRLPLPQGKPTSVATTLPAEYPDLAVPTAPADLGIELVSEPAASLASAFSVSRAAMVDVEELAHDPELEDVAIRFAHGDDAGAENALLALLQPGNPRIELEDTWLALFDLYRATGQQDRFDDAAVDFARRFGRSAPQWVSLPEAAGLATAPRTPALAAGQPAHWSCPSSLGLQSIAALQATLARTPPPWRLNWARLTSIDEAAIDALTRVFAHWAGQAGQLHFFAADNLERVLKQRTVSGERGMNPGWWKLRMEALRVMNRPDEFELVALDYCVTYEVSPPSWERPRCQYKALQADGSFEAGASSVGSDGFRDSNGSVPSNQSFMDTTQAVTRAGIVPRGELVGCLQGDASAMLERLDVRMSDAEQMIISCARLVRIDFSAAGSLLNWAAARQAEGRQLHFTDVHRLVAAFFNVVGLSGLSGPVRVSVRRD